MCEIEREGPAAAAAGKERGLTYQALDGVVLRLARLLHQRLVYDVYRMVDERMRIRVHAFVLAGEMC